MKVTQVTIGRFHHFHLARQLEKYRLLDSIWTGYPKFKLKDEKGISPQNIHSFPWLQTPYMIRGKFGIGGWNWLNEEWEWLAQETLDRHVAAQLKSPTILVGLSGSGLNSGAKAQSIGGYHICDRGSSHIKFQDQILTEEYRRWGLKFKGVDPRIIAKEQAEYEQADWITVPSEFVKRSFIQMGVPSEKIVKIVYGSNIDRFKKVADPPHDTFRILWVGAVNLRKGFLYLLEAFQRLKHPQKELVVVGVVSPELKKIMSSKNLDGIDFKGVVANHNLPYIYSTAHIFVLPSIEEGLAMVQGEALACGCPVIATHNTGAEDLFQDGSEGFIIPTRSSDFILDRLQQLADDKVLRSEMSEAARRKVKDMGGWDTYGDGFKNLVNSMI